MTDRKIDQMMPAQGWVARFAVEEGEYLSPLVGWALVGGSVVGLVSGDKTVEFCDGDADFLGYAFMPDMLEDLMDEFGEHDHFGDDLEEEDDDDDEPPPPPPGPQRRPTRLN